MKTDLDILAVATQLVAELGEDAPRLSKVRLVELIAANNLRAADFWRDVMRASEELLARTRSSVAEAASSSPTCLH